MSDREIILVLGSGPNAPLSKEWPKQWFDRIVAINNAWRVRSDWDDLIFPEDFPKERQPDDVGPEQRLIEADAFVPAQNALGGFVYAGGTMAFTAAYWALHAFQPRVLAFLGCDMVYPAKGPTHFYGSGTADPLREDLTLRDLKAKSARLALMAARQGCACVNLSTGPSELLFERSAPDALAAIAAPQLNGTETEQLLARERSLGYFVPSGRYWDELRSFDAGALAELDASWRALWQSRQSRVAV